ncbi:MAG: DNA polymerase [Candidatus Nomurabacteria bacterium]|nr:DNA polymerase [Candidatus Nomurabacteria bacterium]
MASKKINKKRLILLDSHAIIHRAYHALPEFMNSRGEPTGAIYGLATMLFKIITDLKPDYIIACFDLPKKTFRHEAYADYKAGRAKTDDALVAQLIRSREFFNACSIPFYECEGFEADDLLGTIVEQLKDKKKEIDIIIASGDMDTLQLVDDNHVQVYTLKKGINDTILYNEKKVFERFGFSPNKLPDYKGLRGDPSDNIIGIKGIGEKTATILISKYGTVENIYKAISKDSNEVKESGVTERVLTLLKEGEEEALFSKTLATIRPDAPIKFELPEKNWKEAVDKNNVAEFFRDLEFKSLQNRFLNVLDGNNSIEKNTEDGKEDSSTKTEKVASKPLSEEDNYKINCAKIAYWLLNSERSNPDLDEVVHYKGSSNLEGAINLLENDIKKEKLTYVYENIEIPIISIIDNMEKQGILVDVPYLNKISSEYHSDLDILEKNIWKEAGVEFNINSPKQISEILFTTLGLSTKGIKKSAGGAISTRESELEKLRELHPIIGEILKYREIQKLLSTYIDTIPAQVGEDGRLHAHFIQTGTTTGRFASNNPNLQNIPIKTERGKNIRNAFVAPKGYVLASFDYSQIELRVAALMSQDPYFIKAFNEGHDIHLAVAMKVFGVVEKDVTADMRRRAKVINFGILYGMGVNALKDNLGTDRKEAQVFYDNYFAQFPTIAAYLESIKEFAKKNGYTETLFGRKRYFPGIKSPLPFIRAMAERMATNAPIQGTATADIIKIGMKNADEQLRACGFTDEVRLVLQVHDELVYEIKEDKIEKALKIIENAMKDAIPEEFCSGINTVPLLVSVVYGKTWGDLK